MARLLLFYRLMVRPLFAEPVRTALTVLAIALGVAVVLAIDLAGFAAAGSFRSSMETLAGENDFEIVAVGGVPENVVGKLAQLPYSLRISARMEEYAAIDGKRTFPLLGLDLVAEGQNHSEAAAAFPVAIPSDALKYLGDDESVWVGQSLGYHDGERLSLLINDRMRDYIVRGVFPDDGGNATAIVMDLAAAQRALGRPGHVDRILVKVPDNDDGGSGHVAGAAEWGQRLRCGASASGDRTTCAGIFPEGVELRAAGTGTDENRKMLAAFRWNLKLLSYIALVVGAFLIYNTISVSVVRRRAEIGIIRALGASRATVLTAFIGEAASLGLVGALIGLPLGRVMASGAVRLMSATVEALYVSSRPGAIAVGAESVVLALIVGVGVAIASAYAPAREASLVAPVEAMARGRREYVARVHKLRDLVIAVALAVCALAASRAPAVAGKPLFGYLATLLVIAASALAIPAVVDFATRLLTRALGIVLGVEASLASQSLSASLRRTSVLVGALSTAIAMMTAVGIMVGSFRETVQLWMNDQVPADLYVRAAGVPAADRHPSLTPELADKIVRLPGVAAVDRLRDYEISYEGMPAGLASVDLDTRLSYHKANFLSGRDTGDVLVELRAQNAVVVSEPFANKHHVKRGDSIKLSLGGAQAAFRVVDVYYDYSSERGTVVMDRSTALKYLPDPAPSSLAVYISPATVLSEVRQEIEKVAGDSRILIFSNRDLRTQALVIFDRTFAITYALEAVAVLVGVIGVAGALLAVVIDRRRELGLLRFLGAASWQIRKLILVEAGLLGWLATLAGVVQGFALSLILVFVINKQSFGWTIRFHWPVAILLGALSVVYVATVLAGLYPANVAIRLNPIEVVHEE
ncbi:MAG TPA: FtsX-like permease family protein [Candidatus Sulfotelmatobacter sp.]|nr:FtsX-like permease family protein [Candidatus Sulfotelmatobacter sp.]